MSKQIVIELPLELVKELDGCKNNSSETIEEVIIRFVEDGITSDAEFYESVGLTT